MTELREGEPVMVLPAPGGGWYYEIRWADGQTDFGFRLTRWGANHAANKLLRQEGLKR